MEIEIWKDIKDFEGLYQVSNLGRVKSLDRDSWNGKVFHKHKGRILKPRIHTHGYHRVSLSKNNKTKCFYVHRLVATFFVENPDNLRYVDHDDMVVTNNYFKNLRWVSKLHNNTNILSRNNASSKYLGVSFHKRYKNWRARIKVDKKPIYLGTFPTEEEANLARCKFEYEHRNVLNLSKRRVIILEETLGMVGFSHKVPK